MRIAAAAVLAAILFGAGGRVIAGEGLWETSFDRASAVANDTNHPILMEFWATWCTVCAQMDREVYADQRVVAAMARTVPLRIDVDREPRLARKYSVDATPTLIVTDSFGDELFRFTGSLPADRMLEVLAALPSDVSRLNLLSSALSRNKDDFATLSAMGAELRGAGLFRASTDYYARALKTRDARRSASAGDVMLALGRNAADLRAYPEARKILESVVRGFPASAAAAQARAILETLPAR